MMKKIDVDAQIEELLDKDLSEQLDFIEANLSQKQGKEFYLGVLMAVTGRIEDVPAGSIDHGQFYHKIKAYITRTFQAKIEQIIEEENE